MGVKLHDLIDIDLLQYFKSKLDLEIQNTIDGLRLGGRNYIVQTMEPDVSAASKYPRLVGQASSTSPSSGTVTAVEHGIRVTSTAVQRPWFYFGRGSDNSLHGLIPGETYTLSFDAAWKTLSAASLTSNIGMFVFLYTAVSVSDSYTIADRYNFASISPAQMGTEMTGRCEFTFTLPEDTAKLYFLIACGNTTASNYAAGDYLELANIMMERGNRASDWRPAPEDLEPAQMKLSAVPTLVTGSYDTGGINRRANVVVLAFNALRQSVGTDWSTIATIPEEFRPVTRAIQGVGLAAYDPIQVLVTLAGEVRVRGETAKSNIAIRINMSWII